ncbi:hypothetical protein KR009_007386 [Drosophila setifemur]|nr:hypothetical protein KR009_007386 [Drosophila setifemur]
MTSAGHSVSPELEAATLLSVKEENGVITKVYIAPCSSTSEKPVERKPMPAHIPGSNHMMYQCPYCGNGIRTAGAFKVHLNACRRHYERSLDEGHQPEVPELSCTLCHESFVCLDQLLSHMHVHGSVPKKLKCNFCSLKFDSERLYRVHLDSHVRKPEPEPKEPHPEKERTVAKIFDCIFCRLIFVAKFKHGEVSRRYACDECGAKQRAKEAERQQSVPGKRKAEWSCVRCGRLYKLEGFLMRHLGQCTGPKSPKKRR